MRPKENPVKVAPNRPSKTYIKLEGLKSKIKQKVPPLPTGEKNAEKNSKD